MKKFILTTIETCNECPYRCHSGSFTPGGAYPICRHPEYAPGPWQMENRILPMKGGLTGTSREYSGEIPDKCPLKNYEGVDHD